MKKNFMAIASLLIAAMLLVVSCAPEANVEGKVEDGLVEAVIGLGRSAKDIEINNNSNATIKYKYSLQPAWSSNDTKAPIYGAVSDIENEMGVIEGSYGITTDVPNVVLGKVTPGLWNIHVIGYNGEKKVLEGKASAYFNGSGTKATVFVAPVSTEETVSVTITLKMQHLGSDDYNKIGYSFTNLNGSSVTSGDTPMTPSSEATSPENVKVYTKTVSVQSGFNTVTFSLPGYEVIKDDGTKEVSKGGITKTFLAIPGVDVTITGSVTPAEFVEGKADIKVLSINGGSVTVAAKDENTAGVGDEEAIIKPADETGAGEVKVPVKTLANGVTYTFTYDGSSEDDNINTTVGLNANQITRTYQWYVAGGKIDGATKSTYDFTETAAGLYNVTCVATVSFTKDGQLHQLQTSATMPYVRVLE